MRIAAAQSASDQANGQFPRIKHDLDALAGRKLPQQAYLLEVYRVEAVGRRGIHSGYFHYTTHQLPEQRKFVKGSRTR
jgi:hypothetical protein